MVASRQKKRKGSTLLQLPWYKLHLQGSEICHNISISEQEWGLATNTLCEEDYSNKMIAPSKRRLDLTTHLMQKLFQPAQAFVFSGNKAALNYEIVLYFVSRITLVDSCSLKCRLDSDKSKNWQTSDAARDQDQQYSSLVDAFMEKKQRLESDFQSLGRTTSILDIVLEIHDLERFSVINHLGQFHNRAKNITRHVVGVQLPTRLPDPLHCLPL